LLNGTLIAVMRLDRILQRPRRGKESIMRRFITVIILGFISFSALTLTGCRMEGEIGDMAHIPAPR
jgi:hypothetical protein